MRTGSYSLESNLALLRLYLFYPERVAPRTLAHLLVKALMALPDADFWLCMNLIPVRPLSCSSPSCFLPCLPALRAAPPPVRACPAPHPLPGRSCPSFLLSPPIASVRGARHLL